MLIDSGFFKGYSLTGVERAAKPNSDGMSWLFDFSLALMIISSIFLQKELSVQPIFKVSVITYKYS